jgi:3-deoxy-D-manno-octulosonic-acid transferase
LIISECYQALSLCNYHLYRRRFNKGIHNTLEAAVYGKPVLFGPNYKKFKEAIGLIETGGGVCINSSTELSAILEKFINNKT